MFSFVYGRALARENAGRGYTYRLAIATLKTLRSIADKPVVQRSTIITGVLLAFSGATLGSVGFWVSGGFDFLSANPTTVEGSTGTVSTYRAGNEVAFAMPPSGGRGDIGLSASDYTIRKTVPEVRLQFTVADEHGRLVPDISQSDLRILDDHVPVTRLQQFEKLSDLPLRLGLVLDVSDSMKRVIEQEKGAAMAFLHSVLRPQTDRAFVMAFGDGIKIWQDNTGELSDLAGAVREAKQSGTGTDFYDALYAACNDQWRGPDPNVHRVLLVISDGGDTGSLHGLNDVISAAERNEVQIYALSVHTKKKSYSGDAVLQRVADETGGRLFVARKAAEAEMMFRQLEKELRTQYYVSFRPTHHAPGYHALQVDVKAPQKLLVHARRGYYAQN